MSVVDEIKSKLDIVDYIGRFVPLKKAGRTYKAPCPFHAERTPSFVVNPDKQFWRCYGACGTGGDIFAFAMKQHGWSFREAVEELAKVAGVEVRPQSPEQKTHDETLERLRGLLSTAADFYHEHLFSDDAAAQATLAYARNKRGLTDETLVRFKIGYAPEGWQNLTSLLLQMGYSEDDLLNTGLAKRSEKTGKLYDAFRNRLTIPIRDERGRVVGFGARALNPDDNPKYLNSPQTPVFDKSRLLFALDLANRAIRDSDTAVIVEGYLDAIQAHQAGYTNVVAQMGTALTETQLKLLAPRRAKKIILALDSDAAGQSATRRSLEVARGALEMDYAGRLSVEIRVLTVPNAKDPDDLIRENPAAWAELIDNAMPVADYVIAMETAALPPNATLQQREAVARNLLPILAVSEDSLYRQDNLQKLALRLRIAERDLLAWAAEQARINAAKPPRAAPPKAPDFSDYEPAPPYSGEPYDDLPYDPAAYDALPDFDTPRPVQSGGTDASIEKRCLRILLAQPDLYYHVNRKFRELAGSTADAALNDLCADDFERSDYRALMMLFESAMAQDEMEPLDYMRTHIDPSLQPEFEVLLMDEWTELSPRLRFVAHDLPIFVRHSERFSGASEQSATLLREALTLRKRRLKREGQEIAFLQMDAQAAGEDNNVMWMEHYARLTSVIHRIDVELNQQTQLNR